MCAAVVPGTQIDNYSIESVLGAGSMGDVYGGVDISLGRKVAIKILSERHRDNDELRQRFVREGRAVAAIAHPNVVQVFTTGVFDDRPYIAMEYLDGVDLGTSVEESGFWPALAAARAIRDAANGLHAAAKAGLIHRDVKPSNLVLLKTGSVKVTDFGLAKPLDPSEDPQLTAMGVVVGTPDYIAPEQARGDPIDDRVDIYALGGTLYYLLAAVPPFRTGKPSEDKYLKVVARHLRQPAPDARDRNPSADPELSELARTMMAKKPDQRLGYDLLIGQLEAIVARLERGGEAMSVPASSERTGGQVSPTPYVGSRERPAEPLPAGHAGPAGPAGHDGSDEPDDAAPTQVRIPTEQAGAPAAHPGAVGDEMPAPSPAPRVSRLLVGLTVVSVLVFLTGFGLLLYGPRPAPAGGDAAPADAAADAPAAAADPSPGDAGADPAAAGMIVVKRADGSDWFYVDPRPVSARAYAEVRPQKKPNPRLADLPVTGVSHSYASSYASAVGKRLLTLEEWEAAAATAGFETPGNLWEWVAAGNADELPVISPKGRAVRSARGSDDVTFRLALDP